MENKTNREAEIKEKLLRSGKLKDWDLLELLLTYVCPTRSPQQVTEELKRTFRSVRAIFLASSVELLQVKGMDRDAATLIRLVGEILERFSETMAPSPQILVNSKEVEQFLLSRLSTMKDEKVLLVFLDDQGIILGQEILGAGTVDQVVMFPRQIMERALHYNATSLIIAHNHPHGPPLPSVRDREEAERLREILRPFEITLTDSVVVGKNKCFSIFKNAPL